jgi:hypothetical protein
MNFKRLVTWLMLGGAGITPLATAQNPVILQGNYVSNVFGQSNFILNPNAQTNTANVTVSNATVSRSTTTPLVATTEFTITTSTATGFADWATRTFDQGMKGQNCEARFTYRGFSVGSTTVQIRQGSNTVAQLTLTPSTDPRIASINFPCGDLSAATTLRVQQATASLTGTNELSGLYLGLATNQANVAQAELVGKALITNCSTYWDYAKTNAFEQTPINSPTGCNFQNTGKALVPTVNRPGLRFDSLPPGNYMVVWHGTVIGGSATTDLRAELTDGTNAGARIYIDGPPGSIFQSYLSAHFNYTSTQSNIEFRPSFYMPSTSNFGPRVYGTGAIGTVSIAVYRFPTSSELVVTPERQNVWAGARYFGANVNEQKFSGSAAAAGTYVTIGTGSGAQNWATVRTVYGKGASPTSSSQALGVRVPNLPVGSYMITVRGDLRTNYPTTGSGVYAVCGFDIFENTTSNSISVMNSIMDSTPGSPLVWTGKTTTLRGVYNNTAVGDREFVVRAAKTQDATSGTLARCEATTSIVNSGTPAEITIDVVPLDQPSNSALYVQGPVQASATGAAIPAGFQNNIVGTINSGLGVIVGSGGSWRTGTGITLTPGIWEIKVMALIGNVAPSEVRAGITDAPNSAPINDSTGFSTTMFTDDAGNTCCVLYTRTEGIFYVTTTKTFYPVALAYPAGANFNYDFSIRARQLN